MIELELLAIGALLLVCIAIQAFTLTALQRTGFPRSKCGSRVINRSRPTS